MNEFMHGVRRMILALCAALFAVGVFWNLCYGSLEPQGDAATLGQADAPADWEKQYTAEQMGNTVATDGLSLVDSAAEEQPTAEAAETIARKNQLAALRMERNRSWQKLEDDFTQLEFGEKQQCLQQAAELQYWENRLELLLKAKGLVDCLVLLEDQQANILVDAAALTDNYEKIFDLVQRNTTYLPEQIVLIPLGT